MTARTPTVRDVMTRDVATVDLDTPYADIADLLARHRINAVPVLDDLRRLSGVVSEGDLLRRVEFLPEQDEPGGLLERPARRAARSKARAAVARQLMTAPALTVPADTDVSAAAGLMAERNVKQLPVVDRQGRMIGIVARRDLLTVFRRDDADIGREITESILSRALHLPPESVHVDVRDGAVTLTGAVRQASKAQIAVRLTEAVPGVTAVTDRIDYTVDDEHAMTPEPDATGPRLAVGVDGTPAARQALAWAAAHAAEIHGSVLAVTASDQDGELTEGDRGRLEELLATEVATLPARLRGVVPITTRLVPGRAGSVLTTAAAEADLLVLGRQGAGGQHDIGTVSRQCIRTATRPVIIVPWT